jgi:hypothetical protein
MIFLAPLFQKHPWLLLVVRQNSSGQRILQPMLLEDGYRGGLAQDLLTARGTTAVYE